MLSVREAAEILGISQKTVYRWIRTAGCRPTAWGDSIFWNGPR